jgi:hypothetical protein
MNRTLNKIKNVQQANLMLENRYLTEGNVTIEQLLQGKTLTLFNRVNNPNEVVFEHTFTNQFKKDDYYKNITISFSMGGYKGKYVSILIYCDNPSYIEMTKKIVESLKPFKDAADPYVFDDSAETTTRDFAYESSKTISPEYVNQAFDGIKKITDTIATIDSDYYASNPEWVK